jgi:DHA1 family inner membrane transport protein
MINQLKSTSHPWTIVTLQALALFLVMTVNFMMGPLLISLATEFDTSIAIAGQLATVTFIAWGMSALFLSPLSDIYGRRPIMLSGLTMITIGVVASGFAGSFANLAIARIVSGIGAAMILPTGMAAIADHFPPDRRGRALGLTMMAVSLASIISVPLVAIITDLAGWRWPFFLLGIAFVALSILTWVWFPRTRPETNSSGGISLLFRRYATLLRARQILYIVIGNIFHRMAFFGCSIYLAAFVMQTYQKSEGEVAFPLLLAGIGVFLGSLFGSEVAIRKGRLKTVSGLIVGGGVASAVLFWTTPGLWASMVIAMSATTLLYMVMPTLVSLTNDVGGGTSRGTAMGLFAAGNQTGAGLGSAIGGLVLSISGFGALSFLWLSVCLLSSTLIWVLVRESTAFQRSIAVGRSSMNSTSK